MNEPIDETAPYITAGILLEGGRKITIQTPLCVTRSEMDRIKNWIALQLLICEPKGTYYEKYSLLGESVCGQECRRTGQKASPCAQDPALESPETEIPSRGTVLAEEIRAAHQARPSLCVTCGQPRGRHHAETLACPKDPRFDLRASPVTQFSLFNRFTP